MTMEMIMRGLRIEPLLFALPRGGLLRLALATLPLHVPPRSATPKGESCWITSKHQTTRSRGKASSFVTLPFGL